MTTQRTAIFHQAIWTPYSNGDNINLFVFIVTDDKLERKITKYHICHIGNSHYDYIWHLTKVKKRNFHIFLKDDALTHLYEWEILSSMNIEKRLLFINFDFNISAYCKKSMVFLTDSHNEQYSHKTINIFTKMERPINLVN